MKTTKLGRPVVKKSVLSKNNKITRKLLHDKTDIVVDCSLKLEVIFHKIDITSQQKLFCMPHLKILCIKITFTRYI